MVKMERTGAVVAQCPSLTLNAAWRRESDPGGFAAVQSEQVGDAHVEVAAMEGSVVAGIAVQNAIVVAEADAELLSVVKCYTTAYEDVELLVVLVVVETLGASGGADACHTAVGLIGGGETIAEGGTGIDADGHVLGQVEAVVEVEGHVDVLLGVVGLAGSGNTESGCCVGGVLEAVAVVHTGGNAEVAGEGDVVVHTGIEAREFIGGAGMGGVHVTYTEAGLCVGTKGEEQRSGCQSENLFHCLVVLMIYKKVKHLFVKGIFFCPIGQSH